MTSTRPRRAVTPSPLPALNESSLPVPTVTGTRSNHRAAPHPETEHATATSHSAVEEKTDRDKNETETTDNAASSLPIKATRVRSRATNNNNNISSSSVKNNKHLSVADATNHNNSALTETQSTHPNNSKIRKKQQQPVAFADPSPATVIHTTSSSSSSAPLFQRPQEFNSAGQELFCICRQPYDERRFMIGCDSCEGWFHAKCVNVSKAQAEKQLHWNCPDCTVKLKELKREATDRKQKRKREKEGQQDEQSPSQYTQDRDLLSPASRLAAHEPHSPTSDNRLSSTHLEPSLLQPTQAGAVVGGSTAALSVPGVPSSSSNKSSSAGRDRTGQQERKRMERNERVKLKRKREREERRAQEHRDRKKDKKGAMNGINAHGDGILVNKRSSRPTAAAAEHMEDDSMYTARPVSKKHRRDHAAEEGHRDRSSRSTHETSSSKRRDRSRVTMQDTDAEDLDEDDEDNRQDRGPDLYDYSRIYGWLLNAEFDSSSEEENVYLTSDGEEATADADGTTRATTTTTTHTNTQRSVPVDTDELNRILIDADTVLSWNPHRLDELKQQKAEKEKLAAGEEGEDVEEDEEEEGEDEPSAIQSLSLTQPSARTTHLIPMSGLSLSGRSLLTSPYPKETLQDLQPPHSTSTTTSSTSTAASSSPTSATSDDTDHVLLHHLHRQKTHVECALLSLEKERRVYLAGIDYVARQSVLQTMNNFDRQSEESVLLEEVDLYDHEAERREMERERERIEAESSAASSGTNSAVGFFSPRASSSSSSASHYSYPPHTPRMPSLARRPSSTNLRDASYTLPHTSNSPLVDLSLDTLPLYVTTLTCCGCDGLIPASDYYSHVLSCSLSAPEADQYDWVNEVMQFLSGQWEAGRPLYGEDRQLHIRAETTYSSKDANGTNTSTAGNPSRPRKVDGIIIKEAGRIEKEREKEKERYAREQEKEYQLTRATPVGTSILRMQGLLPLPPLLHNPFLPVIKPLKPRLPAQSSSRNVVNSGTAGGSSGIGFSGMSASGTMHTEMSSEREKEKEREREEERKRVLRRAAIKHDSFYLGLNSISGRFGLQLRYTSLVCGYPAAVPVPVLTPSGNNTNSTDTSTTATASTTASTSTTVYVYCSKDKRKCTEHLLWEELYKTRIEQEYYSLSRRLELLKNELEIVQNRVNERVMQEAEVIGSVLGDAILIDHDVEQEQRELEEKEREERILKTITQDEEDRAKRRQASAAAAAAAQATAAAQAAASVATTGSTGATSSMAPGTTTQQQQPLQAHQHPQTQLQAQQDHPGIVNAQTISAPSTPASGRQQQVQQQQPLSVMNDGGSGVLPSVNHSAVTMPYPYLQHYTPTLQSPVSASSANAAYPFQFSLPKHALLPSQPAGYILTPQGYMLVNQDYYNAAAAASSATLMQHGYSLAGYPASPHVNTGPVSYPVPQSPSSSLLQQQTQQPVGLTSPVHPSVAHEQASYANATPHQVSSPRSVLSPSRPTADTSMYVPPIPSTTAAPAETSVGPQQCAVDTANAMDTDSDEKQHLSGPSTMSSPESESSLPSTPHRPSVTIPSPSSVASSSSSPSTSSQSRSTPTKTSSVYSSAPLSPALNAVPHVASHPSLVTPPSPVHSSTSALAPSVAKQHDAPVSPHALQLAINTNPIIPALSALAPPTLLASSVPQQKGAQTHTGTTAAYTGGAMTGRNGITVNPANTTTFPQQVGRMHNI